jgi:beta-barrel assembly-enhancing protease
MRTIAQLGLATLFTISTFALAQSTAPAVGGSSASGQQTPAASQTPPAPQTDDNAPPPPRKDSTATSNGKSQTSKSSQSNPSDQGSQSGQSSQSSPSAPSTPTVTATESSQPDQTGKSKKASKKDSKADSAAVEKGDDKTDPDSKMNKDVATAKADTLPSPGEALDPHIKAGSEDDVNAVGNRNIGGRGMGNWYSTDWEIRNGKSYSIDIEKSAHMVTDPVVVEYVNRVGQNIVKNSDCKVPFTIKVIDSDEINAMALPGGFFYVNSGLILAADEEAELAGVMAHETAHVCAHHAAREMTRMNYIQIGQVPLIIFTQGTWTGYGIYEAMQLAVPITFLQFSRNFEAEADWLGLQYMYKAGYDPQAFVQFFEKIDALEKHKPGTLAKVFADHPQTPDRIAHSEDEIATIMPARPDYVVTTSEFDDVKARLARIENKRKINDPKNGNKPTLRRSGGTNNDPNNPNSGSGTTDDRPTLGRH